MSRVKHPVEKKRHSLHRDHRVLPLEGNKSFRSAWPLKKALANRRFRRAAIMIMPEAQRDPTAGGASLAKQKRMLTKYGIRSLAESIGTKSANPRLRWNRVLAKTPSNL